MVQIAGLSARIRIWAQIRYYVPAGGAGERQLAVTGAEVRPKTGSASQEVHPREVQ